VDTLQPISFGDRSHLCLSVMDLPDFSADEVDEYFGIELASFNDTWRQRPYGQALQRRFCGSEVELRDRGGKIEDNAPPYEMLLVFAKETRFLK